MKSPLLTASLILVATLGHAQSPTDIRKSKLKELGFLIGTWSVDSKATNLAGDATSQTGTMSWEYDMDSTVIRNQRILKRGPATGAFTSWSERGEFYEYIMFNPARNMYEFISFEYGAAGAPRYWLVDTKKKIYQYRFARFDAARKITLETTCTLKYIDDNELVETFEEVIFETGAQERINTIRLRRVR